MPLRQLRRIRWAVRATLVLGVAASVAANVLHAEQNPIAQTIAAWPPLALLLNVELISRVPMHRRHLAGIRLLATAAIAGIAAWVSYWHMVGVAARYGEVGSVPYLLPISVDGLVIVASVSLVELAGRIRAVEQAAAPATAPVTVASPVPVTTAPVAAMPGYSVPTAAPVTGPPGVNGHPIGYPAGANGVGSNGANGVVANGNSTNGNSNGTNGNSGVPVQRLGALGPAASAVGTPAHRAIRPGAATTAGTASVSVRTHGADNGSGSNGPANGTGGTTARAGRGRPVAETVRLARQLAAEQPEASHDDVARQLGISAKRLRTVLAQSG